MSDERLRQLERHAGDDPAAAAALAAACGRAGHEPPDGLIPLRLVGEGETATIVLPCKRCRAPLPCRIDVMAYGEHGLLGYPRLDDNPDDPDPDRLWELSREWRAEERMGPEDPW